jgi:hypothetical protein
MADAATDREERARLATALAKYAPRYPHPRALLDVEITNASATARCVAAARRIVAELDDDGITVGAEEDAEAAILMVREMADRLCRAMDVHERPTLELLRLGALLARAMDEINGDDGITVNTARALAEAASEPNAGADYAARLAALADAVDAFGVARVPHLGTASAADLSREDGAAERILERARDLIRAARRAGML